MKSIDGGKIFVIINEYCSSNAFWLINRNNKIFLSIIGRNIFIEKNDI